MESKAAIKSPSRKYRAGTMVSPFYSHAGPPAGIEPAAPTPEDDARACRDLIRCRRRNPLRLSFSNSASSRRNVVFRRL
jgi:hypothetical protein